MADIELVIKIDEEMYAQIIDENGMDTMLIPYSDIIRSGTPLPNGHGRLIDADALMEYCQNDKTKLIDCNDIARFPIVLGREE